MFKGSQGQKSAQKADVPVPSSESSENLDMDERGYTALILAEIKRTHTELAAPEQVYFEPILSHNSPPIH